MALIKLKDGTQITVTKDQATKMDSAWANASYPGDTPFAIADKRFLKSSISFISKEDESDSFAEASQNNDERYKKLKKVQVDEYEMLLRLSPEERAKHTEYFNMFFWSMTNRKATQDEEAEAIRLSAEHFKTHHKPFPDPAIFLPMIKKIATKDLEGFQVVMIDIAKRAYVMANNYQHA